jgi:Na+/proline symporter
MSSISACYNSSATLVTRDFVLRFRPKMTEQRQVLIGRWVTVLMAILGVLAAPLVGLSVTLWHYLQFISAYLSVPMSAAIFIGLVWKRSNLIGALSAVTLGFCLGLVFFLDQTLGWSLPVLSHPYLQSFLHRSFIVWVFSVVVMALVSLSTETPKPERVRGHLFTRPSEPWSGLSDFRAWAGVLFVTVCSLWWIFR